MAALRTDYKDDLLDTAVNTQRKYNMVTNADGTVSFVDATTYAQNGDSFGAADINAINDKINNSINGIELRIVDGKPQFRYDTEVWG